MKISVVSPVYRAENIVDELVRRVLAELQNLSKDYELILVEDGSNDASWERIEENCKNNPTVKGIKLSRNFGQHYAVTAGVKASTGDCVILMDCDLQDDPSHIGKLLSEYQKGFDIVFTRRKARKHNVLKSFNSWLYNKLFKIFSEKKYDVDAGSLVLFSRKVAIEFNNLFEIDRLYLQMLKWLGFNYTIIEVEHMPRFEGRSSYTFAKLLSMGIRGWASHSNKLLKISIYIGLILGVFSFSLGVLVVVRYFLYDLQAGWPSLIVTILFSTSLILISIGVTGIYIGKIFDQVKNRPLYVIDKKVNL